MRKQITCLVSGLALTLWISGCKGQDQKTEAPAPAVEQSATMAAPETTTAAVMVTGTIKETMNGGGFTYLLIDKDGEATWYAMPEAKVKVGETITIPAGSTFPNFHSKALDRTFEKLIFSAGPEGATGSAASPHGMSPHGMGEGGGSFSEAMQSEAKSSAPMTDPNMASPGSTKAVVPFAALKVAKATGQNALTVGEAFAKATAFNSKKVRLRGQVMKVSRNIMGKNWLHIQDGTGVPAKNTHDLVVTTAATPAQGDTVTVEGTLSANKDFGAGYSYVAIIEDATVSK
ncbi:MAG: DNA-binding protein [Desulfobulbaceae bacterium]|nr:DNA-binding protein [Desulfobulbaceae bacterium]